MFFGCLVCEVLFVDFGSGNFVVGLRCLVFVILLMNLFEGFCGGVVVFCFFCYWNVLFYGGSFVGGSGIILLRLGIFGLWFLLLLRNLLIN